MKIVTSLVLLLFNITIIMNWFSELLVGTSVAHSVLLLALVIAVGVALAKVKIAGVSLGVTWILFAGIAASHFGMRLDEHLIHFLKEFGLILFVFSIGLQVGPGFFASFKKGGVRLNLMAAGIVFLGVAVTLVIWLLTDVPIATMVGVMSGAVTNTPGLGAAQQANLDMTGIDNPDIATGYAVAYPLAVIGIIVTMIVLRRMFRIDPVKEEREACGTGNGKDEELAHKVSIRLENKDLEGKTVSETHDLLKRNYVISRIHRPDNTVEIVKSDTVLHIGDDLLVITSPETAPVITCFLGSEITINWKQFNSHLISRRIIITKTEINGKTLAQLKLRSFGVNVTRVNRSGIDLVATPVLDLQIGDQVTVVGTEQAVAEVEKLLGNSQKRLNAPNLFAIFLGILLGVVLGSVPIVFPGVPQPVKLGLAGGPLIIAILLGRFGPKYKLATFTTLSANLMLREVGIALFLACVGLGAGEGFVETVVNGGYAWVGYGVLITVVPLFIIALIARYGMKTNHFTLMGLLAGSMTDPPALAFANESAGNDIPAVAYATVYPLTMFLRVLCAQLMILFLA
jgi:putative transport protein